MASVAQVGRPIVTARSRRSFLSKALGNSEFWRGLVAIIVFLCLWELGARSKQLFGYALPYVGLLPAPSEVAVAWSKVLTKPGLLAELVSKLPARPCWVLGSRS